ncbi:MAG: hypothetical protein AAFX05_14865 [Planctomycetota bacterium]
MQNWCVYATASVGVLTCAAAAQGVIIDTFETAQALLIANAGTPTDASVVNGAGILGGERQLEAQYVAGPGSVTSVVESGRLGYGATAGTNGRSDVQWPASGNSLGGVDLTEGGTDTAFALDVFQIDSGLTVSFTVEDTGANVSTGDLILPPNIVVPTTFFLQYADLTGSADLTAIDRIQMLIIAPINETDAVFESLRTDVPTPSAASVLAIAGAGLLRRRR